MSSGIRSQSAMEYLMTYGWAILAVAVVLGVLFQLGVFGGVGTPRAQPGNCQVVKVGTGITQTISLAGECQGQQPQYVVATSSASGGYIVVPNSQQLNLQTFTIAVWLETSNTPPSGQYPQVICKNTQYYLYQETTSSTFTFETTNSVTNQYAHTATNIPFNQWHFYVGTYDGSNLRVYLDGVLKDTQPLQGPVQTSTNPLDLGGGCVYNSLTGALSNVQIYNTTLSQSEITALYQEGIGGAPIKPQNVVGWWPLNGNLNDYSGNNDNGQSSGGLTYSSSWTSGYTAP